MGVGGGGPGAQRALDGRGKAEVEHIRQASSIEFLHVSYLVECGALAS